MKESLNKHAHWLLTFVFGIVVFLFWRFRYPFVLTYQEQLQLFLFDSDYFISRMAVPGGFARYVAEFLVQFFNGVTIGALILAILYMMVQRLIWQLIKDVADDRYYLLSFLPVLMLWYAMGDESVMPTYVVALVMALAVIVILRKLFKRYEKKGKLAKIGILLVLIPFIYWLIGPMVLLVAVGTWPISVVYALACMLVCSRFVPYPLLRVFIGIGYYRFPETLPHILIAIPVVILALSFALSFMDGRHVIRKYGKWGAITSLALLILGFVLLPYGFQSKKYELIEYDYLVRVKDWNGVIAKAERQSPDLPMSVSATNLALGMTNQLGDRAFNFFQRGTGGLLPKFERNFATTQLTGEIYFHLGLVNTAQRLAFEAMEAIPNYNKSARVVKRLAETNLINGEYEVARKYLQMLEKTFFYRRWAQRTMALIGHEDKINAHPLYGLMRKNRLQEDLLFSEQELDKICGQLFLHNPQNQMAAQYLLMIPLLERDIAKFMSYIQVVQSQIPYNPRHCQEALAFAYMEQRQQPPQGLIDDFILQGMNNYSQIYGSGGKDAPGLAQFRNTVWYYLTVGK